MIYPLHFKKILLVTIIFVLLIFNFGFAQNVKAQTIESLIAEIELLLNTVTNLQTQLLNLQPTRSGVVTFNKNLFVGERGEDVRQLQIFLNSNPRTRIANSGPGSVGNETIYFGSLTKNAIIKFQELYFNDVLRPVGLFEGTGFVGHSTRVKLNELINQSNLSTDVTNNLEVEDIVTSVAEMVNTSLEDDDVNDSLVEEIQEEVVFVDYENIALFFPSTYEATRGAEVIIFGAGFTREDNTVYFDEHVVEGVQSLSGVDIEITVPEDLPVGTYDLTVLNEKGLSEQELVFVVVEDSATRPKISTTTPTRGVYGQKVVITGTNFTSEDNDLFTSYGKITDLNSSDGVTLEFNILPFPEIPELQIGMNLGLTSEVPFTFYVANKNGISEEFGTFILEL